MNTCWNSYVTYCFVQIPELDKTRIYLYGCLWMERNSVESDVFLDWTFLDWIHNCYIAV
jgi:hypothetical protein